MGGDRHPGALGRDRVVELRRHLELGAPGGVAGRVVVHAAVGHDRDHGQGARAVALVDHRYGDLTPLDEPLHERGVAVRERVDHRAGQALGLPHHGAPERRPAPGRLDDQRQSE